MSSSSAVVPAPGQVRRVLAAAGRTPRRTAGSTAGVLLALLVALAVPATRDSAAVATFLVGVPVTVVLLCRGARGSSLQRRWLLVAAGLALSVLGHTLGSLLGSSSGALMGAPGQLVGLVAVVTMIDRDAWRERALQLTIALALFCDACLLFGTSVNSTFGVWDDLARTQGTAGVVLAVSFGVLRPSVALLLCMTSARDKLPTALLLMLAEVAIGLGWLVGALSPESPGSSAGRMPVDAAVLIMAMAVTLLAQRADRRAPGAGRPPGWSLSASVIAVLPHLTAGVAGSVLLLDISRRGGLDAAPMAMGILGLGLITVHQLVVDAQHQQLTARLGRSEAYFRTLARTSAAPILIVDDALTVSWCSPSLVDLLGTGADALVGRQVTSGVHRDDLPTLYAALSARRAAGDPETRSRTARVRHTDGSWRLIEITARDLRDDADVGAMVLYLREAAQPRQVDAPQAALEYVDADTGLPSRAALVQRLTGLLGDPDPRTPTTSLVTLAVTGLSEARARGAHVQAELVTRVVAALTQELRTDDWPAQRSTDSFAVLVRGSIAHAETLAHRLVDAITVLSVAGAPLSAVAGVLALDPGASQDADGTGDAEPLDAGEALRRVDSAVASAHATGPGSVRRYDDALRVAQGRRDQLRGDLAGALARGELRMVYQPIVDLALHGPAGVESLMRWQHPELGAVSPADFIPLAEESGLISTLGRWALHEACAAVAGLGVDHLYVAVNVSARHVLSGRLVADVVSALDLGGLAPGRLVLEITESVLLDEAHIIEDLEQLRRLGVRVAVDDFGTGWSSLARLVSLPIDVLKMDRSFLRDLETDPQRRSLCRSVLDLGTSLGLAVVVEGVELTGELQLLTDLGARFIQGFLLARPLELAQLASRLDADDWIAGHAVGEHPVIRPAAAPAGRTGSPAGTAAAPILLR